MAHELWRRGYLFLLYFGISMLYMLYEQFPKLKIHVKARDNETETHDRILGYSCEHY